MKTALWIAIAVIVIGGGIWWWSMSQTGGNQAALNSPAQTTQTAGTPSQTNSGIVSGNSDQNIAQEMGNLNVQMNGLNSDSASVDQGLNDQPVQQGQ